MDVTCMSTKVEPVDQETSLVAEDWSFIFPRENVDSWMDELGHSIAPRWAHVPVKEDMENQSKGNTGTSTIGVMDATTTTIKTEPADLNYVVQHPTKYVKNESRPVEEDNSDDRPRIARMSGDEAADELTLGTSRPFPVALYQVDCTSRSNTGASNGQFDDNNVELQNKRGNIAISRGQSPKLSNIPLSKAHEKSFNCSLCPYNGTTEAKLKQHVKSHAGEKRYKCPLCSYSSTHKGTLKNHEGTHSDEQPYKCSFCPYTSTRYRSLKHHESIHTGDNPYKCSLCPYIGSHFGNLKQHETCHTGERPYKCSLCSYNVATNAVLKRHEQIH